MSWAMDRIEDFGDSVSNLVEGIVEDPKKLVGLAVSIAFPGAAAWIGSQVGLTGVAATIAGNTVLGTISNGGNVGEALKGAVIGAGVQGLSDTVRASLAPGQDPISVLGGTEAIDNTAYNIEKTLSDFAGKATSDVALATLMGKDPVAALVFSGAQAATQVIANNILQDTSVSRIYNSLPEPVRNSVIAATTASLVGKNGTTAAASSLVNDAIRGFRAAVNLERAASVTGNPLSADDINRYAFTSQEAADAAKTYTGALPLLFNINKYKEVFGQEPDAADLRMLGAVSNAPEPYSKLIVDKTTGQLSFATWGESLDRDQLIDRLAQQRYADTGGEQGTFDEIKKSIIDAADSNTAKKAGWGSVEEMRKATAEGVYSPSEWAKRNQVVVPEPSTPTQDSDKGSLDVEPKYTSSNLIDLITGSDTGTFLNKADPNFVGPVVPTGTQTTEPVLLKEGAQDLAIVAPWFAAQPTNIDSLLGLSSTDVGQGEQAAIDQANTDALLGLSSTDVGQGEQAAIDQANTDALLGLSSTDVGQGEQAAIDQANTDALLGLSSTDVGQGEVDAINHDALLNLSSADVGQGETDAINYDALLGLSSAEVGQDEQKAIDDATNTGDTATGGTGGTKIATSTGTQTNTGTNTGANTGTNANTQAADDSGANLLALLALMGSGQRPQQQKQAPADEPYVEFDWSKPFQINPFATQTTTPKMYGGGSIDELLELLQHRG